MDEKFSAAVEKILDKDDRYPLDAYDFVNTAVTYTIQKLSRAQNPKGSRHISGQELVEGAMDHAVNLFAFLAPEVFQEWHLDSGIDIGNIVYNMIGVELLSAGPEDAQTDFECHPDLVCELRERVDSSLLLPDPEEIPILDKLTAGN